MKAKPSRDEENKTRKQRLAQVKRGPGVFVYDGTAVDSQWEPTPLRAGKKEPMFADDGMPILDSIGRQQYRKAGELIRGKDGKPIMGGPPKKTTTPIDVRTVWGMDFPAGKAVVVADPVLARKLRCLGCFDEVEEEGEAKAAPAKTAPAKRGRKPKMVSASAEAVS